MSVFTPIAGSYSNHVGGGMTHPITGAVYFLVTFRANSAGPYRLQVWEDQPPHGDPKLLREWTTGTDAAGPGPWAYGTCTWMSNGSLYVIAPGGVVDGGTVQPAVHIEPNLFPSIPLGTAAGADPAIAAEINRLQGIASTQQQAIEALQRSSAMQAQTITALELEIGTATPGGGLSVEQMADLYWLAQLRQLLRT